MVQVRLLGSTDDIITIKALSFPSICSPLPQAVDLGQFPSFQGLELADSGEFDSGTHTTTIDLLIGSDHYWDVITGNIIRGDSGLVAVSSKFGWLVSVPTKGIGRPLTCVSTSIMVAESLYVDNFTGGTHTFEEGFHLYRSSKKLMQKGGFNLRKWRTNSAV